jgi:hypothetical protein
MKKLIAIFSILFLGIIINSYSQTTKPTTDFFAGKWEITVFGTPNGDAKFTTELVRKDGKLTGELKDATGQLKEAILLTNVEDSAEEMTLYFTAQGYDVNVTLKKENEDNLKGQLMGMFESKAVRIK